MAPPWTPPDPSASSPPETSASLTGPVLYYYYGTQAMLNENGNFVLSNGSGTVWSSFDNPNDTIVPSQNFTLGMVLHSGLYSFSVLSSGNITLKWSDSVPYWDKGLNFTMSLMNLSSHVLGLQRVGILQFSYHNLTDPLVVAYSSDYAEGGDDVLRVLKLDGDGNLRVYSSKRGIGVVIVGWLAVEDQCEVFGYCENNGVCSYNDSKPICGCASQNFEMVDPHDGRKGCNRKVRLEDCVGKVAMLQVEHARFLTYPPVFLINPEVFFIGISACSGSTAVKLSEEDKATLQGAPVTLIEVWDYARAASILDDLTKAYTEKVNLMTILLCFCRPTQRRYVFCKAFLDLS